MSNVKTVPLGAQRFTKITTTDEVAFSSNHDYQVRIKDTGTVCADIKFQKGPIKENGVNGMHHEDLLNIVLHRLTSLNSGDFRCKENSMAITKIEEALLWLDKRTQDRQNRGVEGTSET